MHVPSPFEFVSAAQQVFGFLAARGFTTQHKHNEPTSLCPTVLFVGKNVGVEVSLDVRDACVDCRIVKVDAGRTVRNDEPGGYWGNLHGFLVKHRNYRGSFARFRPDVEGTGSYTNELEMYAAALQALAPEIVADLPNIFDPQRAA